MRKIIIDTNFLMIPFQFSVDIFSEFGRICSFHYKLNVYEQSINELEQIIRTGKDKKAAKLALRLINLKEIHIIKSSEKDVDYAILRNLNGDTIVATQDAELKRKLIKKGASIIFMRQKKYLQLLERKLYK